MPKTLSRRLSWCWPEKPVPSGSRRFGRRLAPSGRAPPGLARPLPRPSAARTTHRAKRCVRGPQPSPSGDSLSTSLDEELDRLPEQYRSPVVLCYLEGRTQTEAARLLATTADAVNSRLKRARSILRRRLTRRGLALSAGAMVQLLAIRAESAALPTLLIRGTTRAALNFMTDRATACEVSPLAVALAKGALNSMFPQKMKILCVLAFVATLFIAGPMLVPSPALGDDPAKVARISERQPRPSARENLRRLRPRKRRPRKASSSCG